MAAFFTLVSLVFSLVTFKSKLYGILLYTWQTNHIINWFVMYLWEKEILGVL